MLEKDTFLDEELLEEIKQNGFTRVLIFSNNKDNIIGVLNVKKLINLPENKKVSDIYDKGKILEVKEEERLDNLLNFFIKKKVHIAFVVNVHKTFLGIVTLEDIIEEIISKEIMDETDKHEDMREVSNSVNNNF
ncbi:MAG: CBS domain-containing protein [Candidatus Pacebacteria bacterium]|nr:CBS domain-containing protein [Candidatus Paceibacterota bacterium]